MEMERFEEGVQIMLDAGLAETTCTYDRDSMPDANRSLSP